MTPYAPGSVSRWLEELKSGDQQAATQLWNRYYAQLLGLACQRLRGAHGVADEEDVAASAMGTFFRRAQQGCFPEVRDRNQLWHLLMTITDRKAVSQLRHEHRQKRGAGRVRSESTQDAALDQFVGHEPSPEFAAQMTETFRGLLDKLDDELQQIVLMKLAAYTNQEIAAKIERSVPTVERRLKLIRSIWQQELVS
jgi:RNA polymerase sigma factor (sigma-70 family)